MLSSKTKKPRFTNDRLDAVFHALSDRTRRALLARLGTRAARITELAKPFAMSLPAVSRHIRVLESAGLVSRCIDGRIHQCSLNADRLQSIDDWLSHYRHFWVGNLNSLARFVEDQGAG